MVPETTITALARILQVFQLCATAIHHFFCMVRRHTIHFSDFSSIISLRLQINWSFGQLSNFILTAGRLPIYPKTKDVSHGFL